MKIPSYINILPHLIIMTEDGRGGISNFLAAVCGFEEENSPWGGGGGGPGLIKLGIPVSQP